MNVTIKECHEVKGTIKISGSKNSALPLMALSLLTNKKLTFTNVPMILDIYKMLKCLKEIGVKVKIDYKNNKVVLKRKKVKNKLICNDARYIRASYYLYPGLIHLHKKSQVIKPGGCNFTKRPIDYHLNFFKSTNVQVLEDDNYIYLERKKLVSSKISFKTPSVGATINAILHSVLIKGKTMIINQPLEPEINDVINCLNKMGACIKVEGNNIIIKGVKKLKKVKYKVMPDRIELGSYLLLASTLNSYVKFTNINDNTINYLEPYLKRLKINYIYNKEELTVNQAANIVGGHFEASSYPLFPTDLQPVLCASLLTSKVNSTVIDNVYPTRFSHIDEIIKLKGNIYVNENKINISYSSLEGTTIYAHDLRCGFALIVCACLARGETKIENFEVIKRGYENIITKLKTIGVQINENCLK